MSKTCSVSTCEIEPKNEKFYYNFPIDFDMCMQWVENLGDPALWQEFQYGGAYSFIHKSVCSDHFLEIDFKVFGERSSGLQNNAIPFKPESLDSVQFSSISVSDSKAVAQPIIGTCSIKEEENSDGPIKSEILDNEMLEHELLKYSFLDNLQGKEKHRKNKNSSLRCKVKMLKRKNEPPEQRSIRLEKCRIYMVKKRTAETETATVLRRRKIAEQVAKVRSLETEEQRRARLEKARIRTAEKRKNMTPEERILWREKNRIQTKERRKKEDDVTKIMRKYNNALRASIKRSQESEEERMERQYRDALRASERRRSETIEEREARLMRERERVAKKRMEIKMTETAEQKQERLRKGREQVYKRRHPNPITQQTPEVLTILKSINEHLNQINQPINPNNVTNFVKASHPDLNESFVKNVIESVLTEDSSESLELTDISSNNASLLNGKSSSFSDKC